MNQTGHISRRIRNQRRWIIAAAGLAFALLVAGGITLALKWPFTSQELAESIQEIVPGTVRIERFHSTAFPYPGCVAEGVSVHASSGDPADHTFVSAQRITIRSRYLDLIFRPGYIARVVLQGLQVHVPPPGSKTGAPGDEGTVHGASKTRVGEMIADGAILDIGRPGGKKPLRFEIHTLRLRSVSRATAISYAVSMTNPLPPGEIVSSGRIGPFAHDIGRTLVSGSYRFQNADLSVLPGIAGVLSSQDDFGGELDQIHIHGRVEVHKFELKSTGHPVDLRATYTAAVNALNGDVFLREVRTSFLQTTIVASGEVAGQMGHKGKVASLNVNVDRGRIQDVLSLFVTEQKPPVTGITSFRADVSAPSYGSSFLRAVKLGGNFEIKDGLFTNALRQSEIDTLSARASGGKVDGSGDPGLVLAKLAGTVLLRNGVATFSNTLFTVPGVGARLDGGYNLISGKVDLHGSLRTEAELSQTTRGVKSVLLKPLDRFFKRKHAGAQIPVAITGTYSNPHFGVDLNPIHESAQANR